jgi:hypothetical protein
LIEEWITNVTACGGHHNGKLLILLAVVNGPGFVFVNKFVGGTGVSGAKHMQISLVGVVLAVVAAAVRSRRLRCRRLFTDWREIHIAAESADRGPLCNATSDQFIVGRDRTVLELLRMFRLDFITLIL